MRKFCCFLFMAISFTVNCQEKFAETDKTAYTLSDTITISCQIPQYATEGIERATIYLLLENLKDHRKWSYRYPLVNGRMQADLIIAPSVTAGRYAVTYLARKKFFDIVGSVEEHMVQDLRYSMYNDKLTHAGTVTTGENGKFVLKNLVFEDTCYFSFFPQVKDADLKIKIATTLDSLPFTIDRQQTDFITIGDMPAVTEAEKQQYKPDVAKFVAQTTLPDVSVETKIKKNVELFDEKYSSGLFKTGHSMVFDGIDDPRMSMSTTVFDFLRGRVPGLSINMKVPTGAPLNYGDTLINGIVYRIWWRGDKVDIFLDEVLVDEAVQTLVHPTEIAMIKVYQPPSFLAAMSGKGAIAIYTKRANHSTGTIARPRPFKIFGYTPAETVWK